MPKKSNKKKEVLTPAYSVFYKLEGISGHNIFCLEDDELDELEMKQDFSGTAKQAVKKFNQFTKENDNLECWVRQVGFIQRGFRKGETCDWTKIAHYQPIKSLDKQS